MNATTMTRTIRCSWVLLLAVLALGVLTAPEVGAEPNNGVKKESIRKRVKNYDEMCETLGGGTSTVNYSYENGKLTSANASCEGGHSDGFNCTFTKDSTECYQAPSRESGVTTRVPVHVVVAVDVVVANPAAATEEIVPVNPAFADAGAQEVTIIETPAEPVAPAGADPVEPGATVETEFRHVPAGSATIEFVEDEQA